MFGIHNGRRRGAGARRALAVLSAAALCVTIAACGNDDPSPSSSGGAGNSDTGNSDPIKVAQITTISGGFPFGDTVKGTESYFNMVNAAGGIDGHQVEFTFGDDKGDPSESSQLARKFVDQDEVVALIGNTSLPDCNTNANFYKAEGLAVIGGGTQPLCFATSNFVPVNSGPYVGHWVMWDYAFNELKPESVCQIEQNDQASIAYYDQLRAAYSEETGAEFTEVTYTNDASKSPVPAVTNAKSKGCDMIMLSTVAPNLVAFVNAAQAVGLDATFMCLGSCYDTTVPDTLGELGEAGGLGPNGKGVFVGAELVPVDSPAPQVQEMLTQFEKDGTPANFWSQIGWLSAALFADGLRQNVSGGDISTREGVLAALESMEEYDSGFAATPLIYGKAEAHTPNQGAQMITIVDGKWTPAPGQNSGEFTIVPPLPPPAS